MEEWFITRSFVKRPCAKPSPFCEYYAITSEIPLIESIPPDSSANESFAIFGRSAGRIISAVKKWTGIAGLAIPV